MNTTPRIASSLLLLLLFHVPAHGQVYVTQPGAGTKDGSSWSNAHSATQLRAAMRAAISGTDFWIAAGTYTPDPSARDTFFIINPGVKVYGGFKGTETALSQRDWVNNLTILSGDIGKKGDSTDNSTHVVVFWYADTTTLLDGCTVTRGNAKTDYGGGIYNSTHMGIMAGSSPTVRHCTISHNRATYGGGGIYSYAYSPGAIRMIIDSCIFEYNNCDSGSIPHFGGGAIFSDAVVSTTNNLIVTNSTFEYNTTNYYGGAILMNCASGTTLGTIKNCLFQFNTAYNEADRYGSGAAINFETFDDYGSFGNFNVTVDSCNFLYNNTFSYGGAIYAGLLEVNAPVLTIRNSLFLGNSSDNAAALYTQTYCSDRPFAESAKVNLYNDIFRLNSVGIGNMGAIDIDAAESSIDSTFIVNCLFDRNSASTIGNRANEDGTSYLSLLNTTIYDDPATAASSNPIGVIYNASNTVGAGASSWTTLEIKNSILYWWPGVTSIPIGNGANSSAYITRSMIKGTGGSGVGWNTAYGVDGGNNTDVYPAFADTANYNLRLQCVSPCRDTGDNAFITPLLSLNDLDQTNRIYNSIVDLGAYEYNQIPPHIMPGAVIDSGFTVTFENLSTGQEDSVEWTFGDGSSSHYYPVNHTYAAPGTYNVCFYIFSCLGNVDTCFNVTVRLHTGIPVVESDKCIIAPNPTTGNLFISRLPTGALIEMYDLSGGLVYKETATQERMQMNAGDLPAGMYFVRITDVQTGVREVHKIVVQH
jgi:predicted outer membrane repeat protein